MRRRVSIGPADDRRTLMNVEKKQSGFSLIETVMATAITATVIIGLLALLPLGLETLRGASVRTSKARIRQAVVSSYKMLDWAEIESQAGAGTGRDFFFDERGAKVSSGDENQLFGARVWVGELLTLSGDITENGFLRELEIRIAERPEEDDAFTNPEKYRSLSATVVKIEK